MICLTSSSECLGLSGCCYTGITFRCQAYLPNFSFLLEAERQSPSFLACRSLDRCSLGSRIPWLSDSAWSSDCSSNGCGKAELSMSIAPEAGRVAGGAEAAVLPVGGETETQASLPAETAGGNSILPIGQSVCWRNWAWRGTSSTAKAWAEACVTFNDKEKAGRGVYVYDQRSLVRRLTALLESLVSTFSSPASSSPNGEVTVWWKWERMLLGRKRVICA